MTQFISATSEK